ncbi:MAG: hypothetical protein E4G92_03250 [Bacteroidia bacterium]|nr:MAG: hypothetical protein E4G92_03250 [Bacteroidia bacterium]
MLFCISFSETETLEAGSLVPVNDLEQFVRSRYDHCAIFSWDQYADLLARLSQERFTVLPLNEMRNTFDNDKVIVGLRHDVDFNPFKALEMAKIEKIYGMRATYFFLATAEYYGNIINSQLVRSAGIEILFREIHGTGAEIGIHNDLLTVMIMNNTDPLQFNTEEINYYKSIDIPIYGTASHGSPVARKTLPNYNVFTDFALNDSVHYENKKYPLGMFTLSQYGFEYEAYHINYGIYLSEAGGKWNEPDGFEGILRKLDASQPGERIQILVHPDWWGKTSN